MPIEIFSIIILLFSMIIHEVFHGSMAYSLGDPTAKEAGRLTLNPLKHLDPFGSVILPILLLLTFGRGFGWAKPVPINPYNFRDKKWGILKVSIAGPAANFLLAIIFGLAIRFFDLPLTFLTFFSIIAIYNFAWGIFNLVPLPPLDGFHVFSFFLGERLSLIRSFLQQYGTFILIFFLFYGIQFVFFGAIFLYTIVSGHIFSI